MASGRRGGPPDLKSTLGSLLRTTLDQASAVREVVEQQTRSRGGLLDQALTQRKRTAAFAKLGEQVYRMAKRGELGELVLEPEIGLLLGELEELDDDSSDEGSHYRSSGPEAVSSADYAARFQNKRGDEPGAGGEEYRVWRPVMPEDATIIDDDAPAEEQESVAATGPARPSRMPRRSAIRQGGGIRFADKGPNPEDPDSDDDLESYMHDDDVPDDVPKK